MNKEHFRGGNEVNQAGGIVALVLGALLLYSYAAWWSYGREQADSPSPTPSFPGRTVTAAGFYENLPITSWGTKNLR